MTQIDPEEWLASVVPSKKKILVKASVDQGAAVQDSGGHSMEESTRPQHKERRDATPVPFMTAGSGGGTVWVKTFDRNESALKAVTNRIMQPAQPHHDGAARQSDQIEG